MDWKVTLGGEQKLVQGIEELRSMFSDGAIQPDAHVFHPGEGRWMCLRDIKELSELFPPNQTLITQYRMDYEHALLAIDHDVAELIRNGKEMQSLVVLNQNLTYILKIHESLQNFYEVIISNYDILEKFGSERLKQWGDKLLLTRKQYEGASLSPDAIEKIVEGKLSNAGYNRNHWHIKPVLLREIDYMLDVLQIIVEPEFVPLETKVETAEDSPNRHIPAAVKLAVWRRDEGQCVLCKSREKLEYDHIIPISKGGSNTERNIQLLCEPCNRSKAANIQ